MSSEMDDLIKYVNPLSDEDLRQEMEKDWNSFECTAPLSRAKIRKMYPSSRIGGHHTKNKVFYGAVVSILLLVCVSLSFALHKQSEIQNSLSGTTFSVSAGIDGPSSMTLPDGTTVHLNARSVLSYNSDFGCKDRRVSLVGEGFFDVAKDAEKQFVVETPNMTISVHGTKFNVYAYPERSIDEMSLVEGSVSVVAGGNKFNVKPGEKVFYDKSTGATHLTKTDNNLETAWLGQELSFDNAPLSNVFDILERRFGVTIKCDDTIDIDDCYTGSFTDRRIRDIMNILEMHYKFHITYTGNIINITTKQ